MKESLSLSKFSNNDVTAFEFLDSLRPIFLTILLNSENDKAFLSFSSRQLKRSPRLRSGFKASSCLANSKFSLSLIMSERSSLTLFFISSEI